MPETISQFSTPAYVADLPAALRTQWSDEVLRWFNQAKRYLLTDQHVDPADLRLFNLLERPDALSGPRAEIPWNGFPRKLAILWPNDPTKRWERADGTYTADIDGRRTRYFYRAGSKWVPATDLYFRDQDEY